MCSRGVWQLERLTVRYSLARDSSRGAREFLRNRAVGFARRNPQLEVAAEAKEGKASLIGYYVDGTMKTFSVEGMDERTVARRAWELRDQSGRPPLKTKARVLSRTPSIQGVWSPSIKYSSLDLDIPEADAASQAAAREASLSKQWERVMDREEAAEEAEEAQFEQGADGGWTARVEQALRDAREAGVEDR